MTDYVDSFFCPCGEKYKDKIKTLAEKNYRSMGAQIRLILETYLDNNK